MLRVSKYSGAGVGVHLKTLDPVDWMSFTLVSPTKKLSHPFLFLNVSFCPFPKHGQHFGRKVSLKDIFYQEFWLWHAFSETQSWYEYNYWIKFGISIQESSNTPGILLAESIFLKELVRNPNAYFKQSLEGVKFSCKDIRED